MKLRAALLTLCLSLPSAALACSLEGVNVTPDEFGLIKVGQTPKQASEATGGAVVEEEGGRYDDRCYYVNYVNHGKPEVRMMVEDEHISTLEVDEPGLKTPEGIEVGSHVDAVKRAYAGKWRERSNLYTETPDIIVEVSPTRGYLFTTDNNRVTGYLAGSLHAVQYVEGCY